MCRRHSNGRVYAFVLHQSRLRFLLVFLKIHCHSRGFTCSRSWNGRVLTALRNFCLSSVPHNYLYREIQKHDLNFNGIRLFSRKCEGETSDCELQKRLITSSAMLCDTIEVVYQRQFRFKYKATAGPREMSNFVFLTLVWLLLSYGIGFPMVNTPFDVGLNLKSHATPEKHVGNVRRGLCWFCQCNRRGGPHRPCCQCKCLRRKRRFARTEVGGNQDERYEVALDKVNEIMLSC